MSEQLRCPICGKPTNVYMGRTRKDGLCREHGMQANKGEIVQCPDCGKWNEKDLVCDCKKIKEGNNVKIHKKCLFCDNETENGNLFCKEHYFKYKDKAITVIIKNLKEFNVIDEYGNRDVKTANGMYVRSQQEKIIYDELYNRGIRVEYEHTIFYKDENDETKPLHPDFFLPDYKLFIEHWGYENTKDKKYIETKKFKEKIYKEQGFKIAGTTSEDIKDIKTAIDKIFFENNIKVGN